jgi:hypothetical protein
MNFGLIGTKRNEYQAREAMNRIYQGKVTQIEIANPDPHAPPDKRWLPFADDPKQAKAKWQAALWQHHQLFQDAVNYYTLALAAMAGDVEGESPAAKALRGWVARVRETWSSAMRKAETFDGPQLRLAPILRLPPEKTDFASAAIAVLRTSRATPAERAAAVVQLLAQKGDLNTICVDRLPWFATAAGGLDATSKAAASSQEAKRQQAVRQFHNWPEQEALDQAASLDLGLFLTQPPKDNVDGAGAAKMLRDYFAKASRRFPELKPAAAAFDEFLTKHGGELSVPSPGRKPSGLYPVAAVFKFFPSPETLAAFRKATKTLAEAKDKELLTDAVADARVEDQPQFDYFTNLALVSGDGDDERDTRAVWFEFDLAAFIEAIKAPRQYFDDTMKREAAAERLRQQIAAMEGKGHESSGAEDESETLPGFDSDTRIDLLRNVVQKKLAWLAEAEGDAAAAGPKEYEIRERTVRGFGEIRKRWRNEAEKGKATEERLLAILGEEQAEHRDDFGSATLYRELAKPENHPIWRDVGTQPWHADDPLAAWLDYKELQADLRDKERAIRFTPAHPTCSPRYFIFPKKNEAQPKTPSQRQPKPGLLSRHDPGQLSFTTGVVLPTERGLAPTVVRIHYAAPRICRDKLRAAGDSNLYEAPWLQPMMKALGLDKTPDRVNFANCRITLQPANERDIQLTFPVEVNTDKLRAAVAREVIWEKQFNLHPDGDSFYNASLRWPHEKQPSKPRVPWHEQLTIFRCLATDLGQRDAGAFARLLASSDGSLDKRPSRFIGKTGDKEWRAALERSGLFRLPGEDARVWRERSKLDESDPQDSGKPFDFREELWGERGRPARPWEADETAELMRSLEAVEKDAEGKERLTLLPGDWREELSFPEQNDKLLIALRRYRWRIARLDRWCWFLRDAEFKKRLRGLREIRSEQVEMWTVAKSAAKPNRVVKLRSLLHDSLAIRLQETSRLLERIANRILPLRGRSWHWEKHPLATDESPLHHLTQSGDPLDSKERPVWLRGQRGLSLERIEQIEGLRKRFQSFNQAERRYFAFQMMQTGAWTEDRAKTWIKSEFPDPCPDLLDKLDNLKEQRVNQTAHMILAEALGLRLAPPPANKKALREECDQHGVYAKIPDKQGQWIGPVDFIVIEDLSRYRASQGRAPRENSRLMKWCHRAVRDKLKQLCEVFGLPVLETPAAYSSRFCSRSGVPGFRATEVTAGFTKQGQWAWLAGKKNDQVNPKEEAQRLLNLDQELTKAQAELERDWQEQKRPGDCPKRTLFVPSSGGPDFVPVSDQTNGADIQPAIAQADINAAINLALRAIADPKLWTIHPRLRTQRDGGEKPAKAKQTKPKTEATASAPDARLLTREKRKYGETGKPLVVQRAAAAKPDDTRQPNFFADFAGLAALAGQLAERNREHTWLTKEWTSAEVSDESGMPPLVHGKSFWGCVKAAQWRRIQQINDARIAKWNEKLDRMPD